MTKVSVIIPVFNADVYLRQCLDSVINQTLTDIEIICIDDGSTDNSIEILYEYQKQDERIKILCQEHSYAGVARNLGISIAQGQYLTFWDADDYFYSNALELMYERCELDQADICICGGRQYYEEEQFESPGLRYLRKKNIPDVIPFNINTAPDDIVSITVEAPWNKMFRRDFIEKEGLRFQPYRNANDVFFVISSLCMAEKVTIVNKQLVCYRKNKKEGLVSSMSLGILNAFQAWLDTAEFLRHKNRFPERSFANRCLESILYLLNNTVEWSAYKEAFLFLQAGNLEKLGIFCHKNEDYYFIKYHNKAVDNLYNMSPEEFSRWIGNIYFGMESSAVAKSRIKQEELDKNKKEVKSLKKEIEKNNKQLNDLKRDNKSKKNKIQILESEVSSRNGEIAALKKSVSYRIGRTITWIPRQIKRK